MPNYRGPSLKEKVRRVIVVASVTMMGGFGLRVLQSMADGERGIAAIWHTSIGMGANHQAHEQPAVR